MSEFVNWEMRGYDAWIELWVQHGYAPTATYCPARWMKPESQERADFIHGWNNAKREHAIQPPPPESTIAPKETP